MKKIFNNRFILGYLILFISCTDGPATNRKQISESEAILKSNKQIQNLNISFLLDLSDRINPNKYPNESMEYYLRDVAYIKSVSEAFDAHLRGKKVRQIGDRIQLYFDPEPQNKNINNLSNTLKYNLNRNNVSLELLDELQSVYSTKPLEIYELAIKDNEYIGSDTWGFFDTKIKDYCIDEGFRNILIILTDGYIYHKDAKKKEENLTNYLTPQDIRKFKLDNKNWKKKITSENFGFISTIDNLSDLEILVLGINPDKKNPYERDILLKYWKDWFNKMNVAKYEIKISSLPSDIDKIIKNFVLKK